MMKVCNRLLILAALLTVGLVAFRGVAVAGSNLLDLNSGTSTPTINPYTGEPDDPSAKKTTVRSAAPQDPGSAPVISRTQWVEWAIKIWAAMQLGEIR